MFLLKYLQSKPKSLIILLSSLSSIALFIISCFSAVLICNNFSGIVIGIILMICAIPLHCSGKKHNIYYLISFLLNSIANGFTASAYYITAKISFNIIEILIAIIPGVIILTFVYLMIQVFNKSKRPVLIFASIINVILLITFIALWITLNKLMFSFAFFCSLISIFYLCVFGTVINHNNRNVFRFISFGSFGLFIMISFVVLLIISEGEILDGADFSLSDDDSKTEINTYK